jgi:hypothetical protein
MLNHPSPFITKRKIVRTASLTRPTISTGSRLCYYLAVHPSVPRSAFTICTLNATRISLLMRLLLFESALASGYFRLMLKIKRLRDRYCIRCYLCSADKSASSTYCSSQCRAPSNMSLFIFASISQCRSSPSIDATTRQQSDGFRSLICIDNHFYCMVSSWNNIFHSAHASPPPSSMSFPLPSTCTPRCEN